MKKRNDHFLFEVYSLDCIKTLMNALLTYEASHINENFQKSLSLVVSYFDIKFCLEEILLNILTYGYSNHSEKKPKISISLEGCEDHIRATIIDNAKHFNPLKIIDTKNDPDLGEDILLGFKLINKLLDKIEYKELKMGNSLTLIKKIAD